jgi:hypothetical protein
MSMHAAPVIALLLTWVPAPASAQSIDQSFYYKLTQLFDDPYSAVPNPPTDHADSD